MSVLTNDFKSVELTQAERTESNIYVCYERSQYHYFKRNHNIVNFNWLFADRIFGFFYSDANEPIIPVYNGFDRMLQSIQKTIKIYPNELKNHMVEKLSLGYKGHTMLKTFRPDGSSYNTNTLFEGIIGDKVYYTKTNETLFKTCLPIEIHELINRFHMDEKGQITISFIKAPESLIENLSQTGINLYTQIMNRQYGFYYKDGEVKDSNGKNAILSIEGLKKLTDYFSDVKTVFTDNGITKRDQLRMHKHVANKIEPMVIGWKSIACDSSCKNIIGADLAENICTKGDAVEEKLKALSKWSSMVVVKPEQRFLNFYIKGLKELTNAFGEFQQNTIKANKRLLSV